MLLSILDTETTGIDPNSDSVIEIGLILYDTISRSVVEQYSTLIPRDDNPAETVNKISYKTSNLASPNLDVLQNIIDRSDYTLIHNKSFDSGFLGKNGLPTLNRPVICTMNDFSWVRSRPKTKKLSEIALDHGIPCWNLHRALTDCKLISDILSTYTSEEIEILISDATEEKEIYISLEPKPGTLSKENGFRWNDPKYPYKWSKLCTKREVLSLPFSVVRALPS
jgi:DNA polymerase-3 subunit epsilon